MNQKLSALRGKVKSFCCYGEQRLPVWEETSQFLRHARTGVTRRSQVIRLIRVGRRVASFLRHGPLMEDHSRLVSDQSMLIDDAAHRLGVSRRTVYYRIRQGRLRTIRTRCGSQRVLCTSIEALLREARPSAHGSSPESPAVASLG